MRFSDDNITVIWDQRSIAMVLDASTGWHSHHSYKIAIAVDGSLAFTARGRPRMTGLQALIVAPHQAHQLSVEGAALVMFIEPEFPLCALSDDGFRIIASKARDRLCSIGRRYGSVLDEGDNAIGVVEDVFETIRGKRGARCAPQWDRRVHEVVERIRYDGLHGDLDQLARSVRLSRFRLSHLFSQEVGVSLRHFALWSRVQAGVRYHIDHGGRLSETALAVGFADQAHFNRSFKRMFGVPPSILPRRSKNVQSRRARVY